MRQLIPRSGGVLRWGAGALARAIGRPGGVVLAVAASFVLLQVVAGTFTLFPDSYRYARSAVQELGASREEAHATALTAFCQSRADQTAAARRLDPVAGSTSRIRQTQLTQCLDRWRDAGDITTTDPRYQAIFATRPVYPLLLAPFVGAFGVIGGMRVFGLLTAVAGSLVVVGLLTSAGLSLRARVTGQVVFLASPLGWWAMQGLGEGLFLLSAISVVWGACLLMRGRLRPGGTLMTGALVAAAGTRYSSALILAAFLGTAAAAAWLMIRRLRHAGTVIVAAISGAGAAVIGVAMRVLDLPSAAITLQDTFTLHFSKPDVADPWGSLLRLAYRFWLHWFAEQATMPYFLVLAAVAGWALLKYGGELGWLSLAMAATGVALITAHPLVSEADRLGVLMWMPMVLGLPLLVQRWHPSGTARLIPAPGHPARVGDATVGAHAQDRTTATNGSAG